jgi:hypothetical protein
MMRSRESALTAFAPKKSACKRDQVACLRKLSTNFTKPRKPHASPSSDHAQDAFPTHVATRSHVPAASGAATAAPNNAHIRQVPKGNSTLLLPCRKLASTAVYSRLNRFRSTKRQSALAAALSSVAKLLRALFRARLPSRSHPLFTFRIRQTPQHRIQSLPQRRLPRCLRGSNDPPTARTAAENRIGSRCVFRARHQLVLGRGVTNSRGHLRPIG